MIRHYARRDRKGAARLAMLVCLLLTVAFQSVVTITGVRSVRNVTKQVRPPFTLDSNRSILQVWPEATAVGLQQGDVVSSIDGEPVTGLHSLLHHFAIGTVGATSKVNFHRLNSDGQALIRLNPISTVRPLWIDLLFAAMVFIVGPWLSLLLTFLVVYLRRNWLHSILLFSLLLSYSQLLIRPGIEGLIPVWILQLRSLMASCFMISLVLFATYFPRRARFDKRYPYAKAILLMPMGLVLLLGRAGQVVADVALKYSVHLQHLTAISLSLRSTLNNRRVLLLHPAIVAPLSRSDEP